ncbi:MAG: hypothetical protein JRG71_09855, partial [Deltaproteobacteria bacterium]|nr:hypothetical protein [Deltaproteobacteria bacterium]
LKGKSAAGRNVIADDKLADVFGIDMDDFDIVVPVKAKLSVKATAKTKEVIKGNKGRVAKKNTPTTTGKTTAIADGDCGRF